ncbi:MAG: Ku protein [Pseudomonadota bacterium]
MARAIWKGAISFGLVHIPVALYPASQELGIDFDWLDQRSMDPVGYTRVNKRTGREVAKDHIVRGVKVDGGDYVLLSDDEIKAAYPKTTQTIAIEAFVKAGEIPFTQLEKPYFLEPVTRGERVYALLREAMLDAGVIGIARVVMHAKESLAALIPSGPALMLNTLRWAEEIREPGDIQFPPEGRKSVKEPELKMARRLIADMTETWKPDAYTDQFTHAVAALVAERQKAGQTEQVQAMEEAVPIGGSNVIELAELLKQSLGERRSAKQAAQGARPKLHAKSAGEASPRKAAARRTGAARKRA